MVGSSHAVEGTHGCGRCRLDWWTPDEWGALRDHFLVFDELVLQAGQVFAGEELCQFLRFFLGSGRGVAKCALPRAVAGHDHQFSASLPAENPFR
jgi:hypothetical protein